MKVYSLLREINLAEKQILQFGVALKSLNRLSIQKWNKFHRFNHKKFKQCRNVPENIDRQQWDNELNQIASSGR